jgi:hypothetical protein
MTHDEKIERRKQLRSEDPNGRRSDNQLDRQIEIEDLHQRIHNLPLSYEPVREILSDMMGLIETT